MKKYARATFSFNPFFFLVYLCAAARRRTLSRGRFYILATKERVAVPVTMSAEMKPFSQHVGELRAHYAGFFDAGEDTLPARVGGWR